MSLSTNLEERDPGRAIRFILGQVFFLKFQLNKRVIVSGSVESGGDLHYRIDDFFCGTKFLNRRNFCDLRLDSCSGTKEDSRGESTPAFLKLA